MTTSITLDGHTVTLRNFPITDEQSFLTKNKEKLAGFLRPDFPDLNVANPASHVPSQTITSSGLTARIHFAPQKTPRFTVNSGPLRERLLDNCPKVVKAVTTALNIFAGSATLRLPNNRIDIFVAEENKLSLGYLWWDGEESNAAIVIGSTAGAWSGGFPTKTVAQEVYEHYRPTWTINGLEKRILAILVHEMGHIFHQCNSLKKYILMARCAESRFPLPPGAVRTLSLDFLDTNFQQIDDVAQETLNVSKGVSGFAAYEGLNEFVAEVFCAKVMGSPYGAGTPIADLTRGTATRSEINAAYTECGGPEPEPAICHTRSA